MWSSLAIGAVGLARRFQGGEISQAISKRSVDLVSRSNNDTERYVVLGLVLLNIIILLPIFLFLSYTLSDLFPTLAIVEDDVPPAYTPVALKDEGEQEGLMKGDKDSPATEDSFGQRPRPVTSSLRSIYRLVYSVSGWKSLFRGIGCAFVLSFVIAFISAPISAIPFVPDSVSIAIGSVFTVQLSTLWTHIMVSVPTGKPFYRCLPNFRTAFRATALPTLVNFFSVGISQEAPILLIGVLFAKDDRPAVASWKAFAVLGLYFLLLVFLVIPSHVILTRVQASLLPLEAQTIVSVDRTLQLQSAEGKEYLSMLDAWRSFSRAAWVRLVKLYVKIFALTVAIEFVVAGFIVLQYLCVMLFARR
ncbi:hypothetical protein F4779DRAFT_599268 [Xylariaceae sp. FL0662B]|nr:hypothetical protein F4779DRAFT_599268 [Xylariaceae sp. FL0662B]